MTKTVEPEYDCKFIGGPRDGAVETCNDIHDEAIDHAGGFAVYKRISPTIKQFIGFTNDVMEALQMCDRYHDEREQELCTGS